MIIVFTIDKLKNHLTEKREQLLFGCKFNNLQEWRNVRTSSIRKLQAASTTTLNLASATITEVMTKIEEVTPHPVMETLDGVEFCINSSPPWLEAIPLGFQHYFLTLGMIVLTCTMIVPPMGGGNKEKAIVIQTMLFLSGLNTFFQSLFGTRLPAVIGSSYAYIIPTTSIVLADRYFNNGIEQPGERFEKTMRGIQGALISAAVLQMTVSYLGLWRNLVRLLTPLSMVPLVTFCGLGLYQLGFPNLANCVEVGLPHLVLMLIFSQYLPHLMVPSKLVFARYSMVFAAAIVWIYTEILHAAGVYSHKPLTTQLRCRPDGAGLISEAPWILFPHPFQWGLPNFYLGESIAMMAASFVALSESTGTFLAVARYGSATPVPPSVLGRGAGWLGFGTLLAGLFGCVAGPSASIENAGLLGLTRVGSRRVIQISSAFMIFFSLFGKFGAVFASVPLPIMAASYCIMCGYACSAGLGFLQFCNLNSFRTKFILGFSCFVAISVPEYFREYLIKSDTSPLRTRAIWLNDTVTVIFVSSAMVAGLVGVVLDKTVERGKAETRKDNGADWWQRFMVFAKDIRSAEFYSLPCKLDKYFPPV